MIVNLVLAFLLTAAIASFLAALYAEDTDTRSWARDIVTGLVGGVVGVVLGLMTGRPRN